MSDYKPVCFADATHGAVSFRAATAPDTGDMVLVAVEDRNTIFWAEMPRTQLREFCLEVLASEQMKEAP